jgi:DNA polymerase-1
VIVFMRPDHILPAVTGPLLVADAPALLYRAFFALPDSITDDDDRPVNALLGSVNQVLWCVEKYSPRAVVLCFGAEAAAYRTEAYPAYHAHRPPMPDALADQWGRAPDLYRALGWTVLDTDDLEADDLLHSLAVAETEAGGKTLILTGDRDLFQCASDSVTVLLQVARQQGPDEVDPAGVRERYGIEPEQVPDFIALRGDPSDGLPGAKGIGAKTAADLLRRKHDLEHVILGAVRESPAVRRALIEQADELRSFRDIALLRTAPVERPKDQPTDWQGGAEAARALGMRRLADRLEGQAA